MQSTLSLFSVECLELELLLTREVAAYKLAQGLK